MATRTTVKAHSSGVVTKGEPVVAAPVTKAPSFIIERPAAVPERNLKLLLHGDVGVGKTTFIASALEVPSMNDLLFLDAEAGDMSLAGLPIDRVRISQYKQLARVAEFLRLHLRLIQQGKFDEALAHQQRHFGDSLPDPDRLRRYRTLGVDSLSEVQKYLMYQLLDIEIGKDALDIEPEVAAQRDWLAGADMIRLLIRTFRDLPMNVIFACAQQPTDVGTKNKPAIRMEPRLPGKLAGEVPGFMDIVGYMEKKKLADGTWRRRMYLASGYEGWVSKHRFRNLPDLEYVDNASMATLLALAEENETGSNKQHGTRTTATPQRSRQARRTGSR